ncbi:MAG: hypothetical protein J0I20_35525 [Chloroflexi bacterium]|nr:hypothetical protein [Chloroflexota bacterium]OJV88322.1 MAG: hypothetical protein BGO39_23870 [Chloroflexi bacterium 54-19]
MTNRLAILKSGRLLADTTPEALPKAAEGQVWSVTTDPATTLQLQNQFRVSSLVSQGYCTHLKIVSPARPLEDAVITEPSLEDAYLVAVQTGSALTQPV